MLDVLHLESEIAVEFLRPERLDTLEEVSEPVSNNLSLPHDGWRWPEQQSQHTSYTGTDHMASLTYQEEEHREEMYSLAEMEFRNSIRRQHSLASLDKSYSSLLSLPSGTEADQPTDKTINDENEKISKQHVLG